MFEKVYKPKGYQFDGKRLGTVVTTESEDREIVQIDATEAREYVNQLYIENVLTKEQYEKVYRYVSNCHGMIHIFAPQQIEPVESGVVDKDHICGEDCSEHSK